MEQWSGSYALNAWENAAFNLNFVRCGGMLLQCGTRSPDRYPPPSLGVSSL